MNRRYLRAMMIGVSVVAAFVLMHYGCQESKNLSAGDEAERVYVAPGTYDDFYLFTSGGYSGHIGVYGLPSGRLFRVIPVFSQDPEKAWGYSEESKPMFMTSYGFIPWDDAHHPKLSQTDGIADGRWIFINANNTPRVARVDLTTFKTAEIIEIPNSGGNHGSPFLTENTEYVVASTRFSVPIPNKDVSIDSYKENFKGTISFIKVDKEGAMDIAFQILVPGFNYDLAHAGKGPSHGWAFFTSYNTEQANTLLEVNASQNDKDFIAAINWKKAEEYIAQGKAKTFNSNYYRNYFDEKKHMGFSEQKKSVKVLIPEECPGLVYYLPTPKSPHGVDVDPTGEYIAAGGKLASVIPVHSFSKMLKAIENKEFETTIDGIPVLKYESVIAGEVAESGIRSTSYRI